MDILSEEIYYEPSRKFFWTRLYTIEPDGSHRTVAVVGAGKNYLNDFFKIPGNKQLENKDKNEWLNQAINDVNKELLTTNGDKILIKTYAYSTEGMKNGLEFLNEVTP